MPSSQFIVRHKCPACDCPLSNNLLKIAYEHPLLTESMTRLYEDVGRYFPEAVGDGSYELKECGDCSLIYQTEVPSPTLMADVYGTWHTEDKTRKRWHTLLNPGRRLEIAREVAVSWNIAARPFEPLRILDYGCGLGMWGSMARAFGAETWGLEFSPSRRVHCAALGIKMTDEADLPNAYFDYIQLDQVLEHLVEPRPLLEKLLRLLRPGGVLCVAVPQGGRVKKHLMAWQSEFSRPNLGRLMPVVPLLHLNCFTHSNLRRLGESCGFCHLRPSLSQVLPLCGFSLGLRSLLKAAALPFYLRSGVTTRIYLKRPDLA